MTTIFIYGSSTDKRLKKMILRQFGERYSVVYADSGGLLRCGRGYELVFADVQSAREINADIVIFKENAVPEKISINPEAAVIANSANSAQLHELARLGCGAVTCGSGATDTLSFSSNTADSRVAALGRSFTALSGKEIQPLEIPTEPGGCDYYVLAVTALRLLLDDYESDLGALY